MSSSRLLLLFFCLSWFASRADELQNLRAAFQGKVEAAAVEEELSLHRLGRLYADRVDAAFEQGRAAADLDLAQSAREERERFAKEKGMPAEPATHPVLLALQKTYQDAAAGFRRQRAQTVVTLTGQMDTALERQERSMTMDGRINEALAVRKERDALLASESYLAMRELVKVETPAPAAAPDVRRDDIWVVLKPDSFKSGHRSTKAKFGEDGSILVSGVRQTDTYLVESTSPITKITAIRVEALTDSSLPQKGPGRTDHGNFVLSEFTAQAQPATTRTVRLTFSGASATFNQGAYTASAAIDGQEGTGWAVGGGGIGRDQSAVFTLAEPLALPAGVKLMFSLGQHYPDGKHLLGKFRISVTDQEVPQAPERRAFR